MKKKIVILATSIGIFLGIGSLVAVLVLSSGLTAGAICNAVVSITQDAPPYLFSVPAPRSARPDAAAAVAGHDTLAALYPKMKAALDQQLAGELAMIPDGAGKQQGIQVGHTVAARLIAMRATDGSAATSSAFV